MVGVGGEDLASSLEVLLRCPAARMLEAGEELGRAVGQVRLDHLARFGDELVDGFVDGRKILLVRLQEAVAGTTCDLGTEEDGLLQHIHARHGDQARLRVHLGLVVVVGSEGQACNILLERVHVRLEARVLAARQERLGGLRENVPAGGEQGQWLVQLQGLVHLQVGLGRGQLGVQQVVGHGIQEHRKVLEFLDERKAALRPVVVVLPVRAGAGDLRHEGPEGGELALQADEVAGQLDQEALKERATSWALQGVDAGATGTVGLVLAQGFNQVGPLLLVEELCELPGKQDVRKVRQGHTSVSRVLDPGVKHQGREGFLALRGGRQGLDEQLHDGKLALVGARSLQDLHPLGVLR
eukprot:3335737-Lingulodinium_polyedra.AAC.2